MLRRDVLAEPEGEPAIGRRDPEDVGPLDRVDQLLAALVDDPDRQVGRVRRRPGRVHARPLVDDRERMVVDRRPHVAERLKRRELVVELGDAHAVAVVAGGQDAALRALLHREVDAVRDRLSDLWRARKRRVHDDRQRRRGLRARAPCAAAARGDAEGERER